MNFADLYRHANQSLNGRNIPIKDLIAHIKAHHPRVGDVELYEVDLSVDVSIGHMIYEEERTSPYEDPFDVAIIRFERSLNRCWRRFVCCKELMHVFDSTAEKTSSQERLITLLNELETTPLHEHASEMFKSEREAIWMAMLILCPRRLRDMHFSSKMTIAQLRDVAEILKIPIGVVSAIYQPYYFVALERLTGEAP